VNSDCVHCVPMRRRLDEPMEPASNASPVEVPRVAARGAAQLVSSTNEPRRSIAKPSISADIIGTSNTRTDTFYRIQVRRAGGNSSVLRTLADFQALHAALKRERARPPLPWMLSTSLMTSSQLARMTYLGSYLSKLLETDDWLDAPALQEFLELPGPQRARSSRYGGETVLGTGDAPTALASPPRSASTDHPHPKLHPKLARPPPVLPTPSALLALLQECAAALEAAELANDGAPPAVGSSQGSSGFVRVRSAPPAVGGGVEVTKGDHATLTPQLLICSCSAPGRLAAAADAEWVATCLSRAMRSNGTLLVAPMADVYDGAAESFAAMAEAGVAVNGVAVNGVAAGAHAACPPPPLWMHTTTSGLTMRADLSAAAPPPEAADSPVNCRDSARTLTVARHSQCHSQCPSASVARPAATAASASLAVHVRADFAWALQAALYSRRVTALAAGKAHVLALCAGAAAEVLSWGSGQHGQLGHGTRTSELFPRPLNKLSALGPLALSCGAHHSLVLTRAGVTYAFGDGAHGQLGTGQLGTGTLTPVEVAWREALSSTVGQVHAALVHAIAAGHEYSILIDDL
jgi:hypothetical protein